MGCPVGSPWSFVPTEPPGTQWHIRREFHCPVVGTWPEEPHRCHDAGDHASCFTGTTLPTNRGLSQPRTDDSDPGERREPTCSVHMGPRPLHRGVAARRPVAGRLWADRERTWLGCACVGRGRTPRGGRRMPPFAYPAVFVGRVGGRRRDRGFSVHGRPAGGMRRRRMLGALLSGRAVDDVSMPAARDL